MGRIAAKVIALASILALAFALTACATPTLGVDISDDGVHAVAENGAEGTGAGSIDIKPGFGMCINHIVNKGSFHVKATDESGTVVFDEDITDNVANFVPVSGHIDLEISAKNADGTLDIIPYDIEAMEQADATLDDALAQEGMTREDIGLEPASGKDTSTL